MKSFTAALAAITALVLAAPSAQASEVVQVDATFAGSFHVSSGGPGTFQVKERASGSDATLGGFSHTVSVRQSPSEPPSQCPTQGSSTGQDGSATITFADGKLSLELLSGAACLAFPTIDVTETWEVAGGTGRYAAADGQLDRTVHGDVRTGAATGTWRGAVTLD